MSERAAVLGATAAWRDPAPAARRPPRSLRLCIVFLVGGGFLAACSEQSSPHPRSPRAETSAVASRDGDRRNDRPSSAPAQPGSSAAAGTDAKATTLRSEAAAAGSSAGTTPAPPATGEELPVDRLLRRLTASGASPCQPERTGELFELASLLTTRDRELATVERAQPTARIALTALAVCTGWQRGTVLSAIGAMAATWPQGQKALYDGGAVARLRLVLAEEVAERRRGQALFALGALFPAHERAGLAAAAVGREQDADRALLRRGLRDPSRFVRRQAVLAATLARDEALDGALLSALRSYLEPLLPVRAAPSGSRPKTETGAETGADTEADTNAERTADPATLRVPQAMTPAQARELLPLLPSFIDLLLSLPPPHTEVALTKALQLAQVVAAASRRSGTAQFLLAQVQSRRRDPAATATLRRALSLGNLPAVFLTALGPDGRALAAPIDIAAARNSVRMALLIHPARPAAKAAVTTAQLRSGQVAVRRVSPAALAAQAAAVVRGPGLDSDAARALGAELFASYSFGSEEYYDPCLRSFLDGNNQDLLDILGLSAEQTPAGGRQLVGVVNTDSVGPPPAATSHALPPSGRYGVTCALCHSLVDEQGIRRDGLPSRTYDQGLLLAACVDQPIHQKSGNRNLGELLDYRPGRNDSSSDGVHNPTEIPSLFGLRVGGPVRWNGDTPTLEVQIDRNLSPRSAPPAVIALVAAYLRQLPLPPAAPPARGAARLVAAGAAVFARTCQRCHAPPAYTTGEIVAQSELGTDFTRVSAVLPNSSEGYKIPSLLRISRSAPYLHDGSLPTLEALLDLQTPSRLQRPQTAGHRFGLSLPPGERRALLAFLRTL